MRPSSGELRYLRHNISIVAGIFLAETGTKGTVRSPLGRSLMISMSRFFHSPASPEDPPWASACKRRITSGVIATRFFRENAISGEFLLRAVARPGSPNHQRPQPIRGDGNALDSIRRFGTLDDRLLAQYFQNFRLLSEPEVLLSACLHACPKQPASSDRDREGGQFVGVESQHVSSSDGLVA